ISGSSSFARRAAVTPAPAAAAIIQIHFLDLPLLCRAGGTYADPERVGEAPVLGFWLCEIAWATRSTGATLLVTITGLFGNAGEGAFSITGAWGAGTFSAPRGKGAGSSPPIISDATIRTIVADIHREFEFIIGSFRCEISMPHGNANDCELDSPFVFFKVTATVPFTAPSMLNGSRSCAMPPKLLSPMNHRENRAATSRVRTLPAAEQPSAVPHLNRTLEVVLNVRLSCVTSRAVEKKWIETPKPPSVLVRTL